VLHIPIWEFWGVEIFFGWLSGDGSEFWSPYGSVPPLIGEYGVRLIRPCL